MLQKLNPPARYSIYRTEFNTAVGMPTAAGVLHLGSATIDHSIKNLLINSSHVERDSQMPYRHLFTVNVNTKVLLNKIENMIRQYYKPLNYIHRHDLKQALPHLMRLSL